MTLGSALHAQGYESSFLYGGDGFFDNMNYFFGSNGYRVVDLPIQLQAGKRPTFANAWGACDEDAFAWSLDEADKSHAAGKPFHHFVMNDLQPPSVHLAGRSDRPEVRQPRGRRGLHGLRHRGVPPGRRGQALVQGHGLRHRRRPLRLRGRQARTGDS